VREGNFALDGLLGFDLNGKTVGVIGTGKIGPCSAGSCLDSAVVCWRMTHSRARRSRRWAFQYVPLSDLLSASDIVALHLPLTPDTHHLIDADALAGMKPG
jgi:D-lactate dehydrogenase